MLSVTIVCVGKLKEKYLKDALSEYSKRLTAYCKFSVLELDEFKVSDNPSKVQIEKILNDEGSRILSKIPADAMVVALCIEGKLMSSEELSKYISRLTVTGTSKIVFVIGGSWGLSLDVKNRADLKLSFSPMTFPHQLMRVMLAEQVYRAFQISSGGKYHK